MNPEQVFPEQVFLWNTGATKVLVLIVSNVRGSEHVKCLVTRTWTPRDRETRLEIWRKDVISSLCTRLA